MPKSGSNCIQYVGNWSRITLFFCLPDFFLGLSKITTCDFKSVVNKRTFIRHTLQGLNAILYTRGIYDLPKKLLLKSLF